MPEEKGEYPLRRFKTLVEGYRKVTGLFGLVGAAGLFLMVALTFCDVILRYIFHAPITGSQEMMQFLMIITMYGGMPIAAAKGLLLSVDALAKKFHPAVRRVMSLVFTLLCTLCAALMCIKMFEQFLYYAHNPMLVSTILKWPFTPFYLFAALGLFFLAVEMLLETVLRAADFSPAWRGAGNEKEAAHE